jgi:hypothetical protein
VNEEAEVSTTKPAQPQTPDEIEAEIAATRARLAETVDELVDKAHPRNIAKRQVEQAKSQVFDADGNLRTEKIASVAGAIAGVLVLLLLIRRLVNRK